MFGLLTVVPIILVVQVIAESIAGHQAWEQHAIGLWAVALAISAGLVVPLNRWLETRPARVVIDKATGVEFTLRQPHTLFFIPLGFWPAILVAIAVITVVSALLQGKL